MFAFRRTMLSVCSFLLWNFAVLGSTFVVPTDRELVEQAEDIIIGTVLTSYSQMSESGEYQTIVLLDIEESVKNNVSLSENLKLVEMGGEVGNLSFVVIGAPQYEPGEEVMVFVEQNADGEWTTLFMALGKFENEDVVGGASSQATFSRGTNGEEIFGWTRDGRPFEDRPRDARKFLQWVRATAAGRAANEDYLLDPRQTPSRRMSALSGLPPAAYLATSRGPAGVKPVRRRNWASTVVLQNGGTQAGASGGGVDAILEGIRRWVDEPTTDINVAYGGPTDAIYGLCFSCWDRVNSVQFGDPNNEIPGSFTGTGVLAIGGYWLSGQTHSFAGDTFYNIYEVDIVIQDGLFGSLLTDGRFDDLLTHEIGHTMGFRHSDQGSPSTSLAIMKSNLGGYSLGQLQPYDLDAIVTVYGPEGGCRVPYIIQQPQSQQLEWGGEGQLSVGAGGAGPFVYQWYLGPTGEVYRPVGANAPTLILQGLSGSTQVWVRVTNSCGSIDSASATIVVAACQGPVTVTPPQSQTIPAGRTADLFVNHLGNHPFSYQWFRGARGDRSNPVVSANTRFLSTPPLTATTRYWLLISNSCGSVETEAATITILCDLPQIATQPQDAVVEIGRPVRLDVAAAGPGLLSYQWFLGTSGDVSRPYAGAIVSTFLGQLTQSSPVWVRVTSSCGFIDSRAAMVRVFCNAPRADISANSLSIARGGTVTLSANVMGSDPIAYTWYVETVIQSKGVLPGATGRTFVSPPLTSSTTFWVKVTNGCGQFESVPLRISISSRKSRVRR